MSFQISSGTSPLSLGLNTLSEPSESVPPEPEPSDPEPSEPESPELEERVNTYSTIASPSFICTQSSFAKNLLYSN